LFVTSISYAGHHFESKLALEHPQYDMTDVYVFRATEPGKTVVIMCMNPTTQPGKADFGKSGLYSFHFGHDRELKDGRTITFKFDGAKMNLGISQGANPKLGEQGEVKSSGAIGETVECPSGIRWWSGAVNDPFFGNGIGLQAFKAAVEKGEYKPELFNNGDQSNALFGGKQVSAIVMEVPDEFLGKKIYYYATSAWYDHDHWHQVNRIAHVLLPHLYLDTPEHNKAQNEGRPINDKMRRQWVNDVVLKFAKASGRKDAAAYAEKITNLIMPDVVPYVIGTEASYGIAWLNGRKLSDDAMDTAMELLTGRFIDDYVRPTGHYQHDFPYLVPSVLSQNDNESQTASTQAVPDTVDFAQHVWPILDARCIQCHAATGLDGKALKPKARIALDTAMGILEAKRGKAVVPSHPESSALVAAISREKRRMPPTKAGEPLTRDQIEIITRWIQQGANFGDWKGRKVAMTAASEDEPSESDATSSGKLDLVKTFPHWTEATGLKGDASLGKKYFETKTINTSLTCISCHSFDPRDNMQLDGDGLLRAGFPVYAAAHRTNIKGSGTNLVALGGNMCVVHFMKGPKEGMAAQELANMDAYLQSGGGIAHAAAKNVDYPNVKWSFPKKLSGGDRNRGAKLVMKACISCHTVSGQRYKHVEGGGELEAGSYGADDLQELAERIRNPEFKINDEMPGFSDVRMSNQQLLDILAWLTE
jgi:mono/diheme cytochrome c family protein